MLRRALRRRCPRCGGPAFRSWHQMREACPDCGLAFEREPGYWVGAVIINTTVIFATFLATLGILIAATWPNVPWMIVLIVTAIVNIVVPVVFYPMSKILWLGLELSWHPLEPHEIASAKARVENG